MFRGTRLITPILPLTFCLSAALPPDPDLCLKLCVPVYPTIACTSASSNCFITNAVQLATCTRPSIYFNCTVMFLLKYRMYTV